MKKENIQNFSIDYAYEVNSEICDIRKKLKNSLSSKEKGLLYKRLHEIGGVLEAIDNFRAYVRRYPNGDGDFEKILNEAKNYAHNIMSRLSAVNINDEVEQAIINAYIKGLKE